MCTVKQLFRRAVLCRKAENVCSKGAGCMGSRKFLLFWIPAVVLLLTGCGRGSGLFAAMVYGPSAEESVKAKDIRTAIESYGESHGYGVKLYKAASDSETAYKDQFDEASDEGARYVFTIGEEMAAAVYDAQNAHHGTSYIYFDGVPRPGEEYESQIRKNTVCISFEKDELGFLAGYTAVRAGFKTLVFISGEENEEDEVYFSGFLAGVNYAASSLGISDISVGHERAGSGALTPRRMTDAVSYYQSGADLIVTDAPGIAEAVAKAAEQEEKKAAAIGFDASGISGTILYSVLPDYKTAATVILQLLDSRGFEGGQTMLCGSQAGAITLKADFANVSSFSQEDVNACTKALADGSASTENIQSAGIAASDLAPVSGSANAGVGGLGLDNRSGNQETSSEEGEE